MDTERKVNVEALMFYDDEECLRRVADLIGDTPDVFRANGEVRLNLHMRAGTLHVYPHQWIIKVTDGSYVVMEPEAYQAWLDQMAAEEDERKNDPSRYFPGKKANKTNPDGKGEGTLDGDSSKGDV